MKKVLALVLALVFISVYSKHFTKPLIQMSEVANRIANLDFSAKCQINRADEIGALAENINELPGFNVKLDWDRYYPYGNVLSHVIGIVGSSEENIDINKFLAVTEFLDFDFGACNRL